MTTGPEDTDGEQGAQRTDDALEDLDATDDESVRGGAGNTVKQIAAGGQDTAGQ